MRKTDKDHVRIGVGVIVSNEKAEILLGKRLTPYLHNFWSLPAGHMEFGESFIDAAKRELREETGLNGKKFKLIGINNYIDADRERQYVNIDFLVTEYEGHLVNLEPDLCECWLWFSLDDLPIPLSPPTIIALKSFTSGMLCVTNHPENSQ